MKKLLSLLFVSVLICCLFIGCGRTTNSACPHCNEAISPSDSFCSNCGCSLNEATISATQETSPINTSHPTNTLTSPDTKSQSTNPVHTHLFIAANCSTPATCSCGETYGEPLGHNWQNATCDKPSRCTLCNETKGEPIGHNWIAATYSSPKTCSICKEISGSPLEQPTQKRCLLCDRTVERSTTNYCESHDCNNSSCPYPARGAGSSTWITYCDFHACPIPGCMNYNGGSGYCANHNE